MNLTKVDFKDTQQFSALFLDYINGESQLSDFYGEKPEKASFGRQMETKSFPETNRSVLCQALNQQYEHLKISDEVHQNLELLSEENTFTVTTGHQLNIFTGPLYFIYKIVSVVNTCQQLKKTYPDKNFVPVYWMASEDHDFDEISYFNLNGKKYKWETSQTGAVGKFDPTELKSLIQQIPGVPEFFKNAYLKHGTLAEAVRYYVNELFGHYGLVVIDGDDHQLKRLFTSVMEDDIFMNTPNDLVEKQSQKLESLGYKTQIFPREINFFYMKDGLRSRIVKEESRFKVLDSDLSFSEEELKASIEKHPERFSPNVVLRPVYQEVVLPNLAYIGGPAEVGYWLQLRPVFDHYSLTFPVIMPRNFAMVVARNVYDKLNKTGLEINDLFLKKEALLKKVVKEHATHDIHLNGELANIMSLFDKIKAQAAEIDPTLAPHVEAQQVKTRNRLEIIEKKFIRAEKRHQTDRIRQIESILNELFPGGSPQERVNNFLNIYQANPAFVDQLITYFEPFDFRFNVLVDG